MNDPFGYASIFALRPKLATLEDSSAITIVDVCLAQESISKLVLFTRLIRH